jgi:hypothetical protein
MKEPAPIIELPIGYVRTSILWQSQHKIPTFGGMGENLPILVPPEHRMRLKSSLFRYFQKITFFPETEMRSPPLDDALDQGFRYVTLDMRVITGIYRKKYRDEDKEKKQQFLSRLQELLGKPWIIEGPLWVWDLHKDIQKPTILKSAISMEGETALEAYLRSRTLELPIKN